MSDSVLLCLQAPWFQQLDLLHEYIVDSCLKHSASLLPKRYVLSMAYIQYLFVFHVFSSWIKELRNGLLGCCHDNKDINTLPTTLSTACKLLNPQCKVDSAEALSKKRHTKLMYLFDSILSYNKVYT